MKICKTLVAIASLVLVMGVAEVLSDGDSGPAEASGASSSDDYFYDASLSQAEIDKMRAETAERERERERQEAEEAAKKREKEPAPEWFLPSNNTDDPMAKFMENAFKEYMKKMQQDYMEKMKNKKKSEIDHAFWSVVTLAVFFGTGILIGVSIVVIRGSKFNKSSRLTARKSTNGGAARDSVINNKNDYVSVPQNDKITI